jgi:hypothetical protein
MSEINKTPANSADTEKILRQAKIIIEKFTEFEELLFEFTGNVVDELVKEEIDIETTDLDENSLSEQKKSERHFTSKSQTKLLDVVLAQVKNGEISAENDVISEKE